MNQLQVYLNFNGTCEEALNHYATVFNGVVDGLMRYGDAPDHAPTGQPNRVLHARLVTPLFELMASDTPSNQPLTTGTNVALSVSLSNEAEQTRIFQALAPGGQVLMPLEDTFWNSRFGMVQDRYGIRWMLDLPRGA